MSSGASSSVRGSASGLSSEGWRSSGSWSSLMPADVVAALADSLMPPRYVARLRSRSRSSRSLLDHLSAARPSALRREAGASGCGGAARSPAATAALQPLARVGPLAGVERLLQRDAAAGQVADRSRRRCRSRCAAVSTNSRSTGAPWPGTTTVAGVSQPEHDVEAERPVHRPGVVAERRRGGLLDQVPGEHDVDVRYPHHEVAGGVAAPGVDELDRAVAEVEDPAEENVWSGRTISVAEHVLAVRVVRVVGVALLDPLGPVGELGGGVLVGVDRDRARRPRGTCRCRRCGRSASGC